jgi:uncharacterized protein YqjF (DUF2071 family)
VSDDAVARWAVLAALGARRAPMAVDELQRMIARAGVAIDAIGVAIEQALARGHATVAAGGLALAPKGASALLDAYGELAAALAAAEGDPTFESCPSVPWLTTVQTEWIEAVSLNYAVDASALARLLPAPIEPEIWHDTAWVQVLVSSLRDMRPQGLGALFGVNFYQVSYRAAVRWRRPDGSWRRGGYFVRSETNHTVMRAIGNRLAEFRFHDFGLADMAVVRDGADLTIAIDAHDVGGKLVGVLDTTPLSDPPAGSVWPDLEALREPLVECYDALGVDREGGWMYVLTIDREPWNARFASVRELWCEYFDSGPLAAGARLDSALWIPRCAYRWKPLRRERLA